MIVDKRAVGVPGNLGHRSDLAWECSPLCFGWLPRKEERSNVAVLHAICKMVVHQDQNSVGALALIIPSEGLRGHELKECLISVDEIESLTGSDFLSALPVSLWNSIGAAKAQAITGY